MGLRQNILTDPVSELNLREVITVQPETTVRRTAELMREKRLGCVVVIHADGRLAGKFTERQVLRLLVKNHQALDEPVQKHMNANEQPMSETCSIGSMVSRMQTANLRFLMLADSQGKVSAISGQKGLMEYITEHFPRQIKVQRMKSKIFMDEREGA